MNSSTLKGLVIKTSKSTTLINVKHVYQYSFTIKWSCMIINSYITRVDIYGNSFRETGLSESLKLILISKLGDRERIHIKNKFYYSSPIMFKNVYTYYKYLIKLIYPYNFYTTIMWFGDNYYANF